MTTNNRKAFSWKARAKSFSYAWDGIKALMATEHNAYIHLALSVVAFIAGFLLHIGRVDWMALVVVTAMVWASEIFNTALEKIMDFISIEKHPQIKLVKDLAAAAVLITAIAAVVVGCIIFIPKLLQYV